MAIRASVSSGWNKWRSRSSQRKLLQEQISVSEQLFLNPIDQWYKYGRFPVALVLHALLVILVTCQVQFYIEKDIVHSYHTARHVAYLLLGTGTGKKHYYTPSHLQHAVQGAVSNIFDFQHVTFNFVELYFGPIDGQLLVDVTMRNGSTSIIGIERQRFLDGKEDYLKQVFPTLYSQEVRYLREFSFSFGMEETVIDPPFIQRRFAKLLFPFVHETKEEHFIWNVTTRFDGSSVGRFEANMAHTLRIDSGDNAKLEHSGLHLSVLALAGLSSMWIAREVFRSVGILKKVRQAAQRVAAEKSDDSHAIGLTLSEQCALFNLWWAFSIFNNIVQVYSTIVSMMVAPEVSRRLSLLGWSCFLSWINICQHFEAFPGYYFFFNTTSKGIATIGRYMISIMPILTAFMVLGTCQFWQASIFKRFSASYASLFSLLNGDMVHDVFDSLWDVSGMFGHIYLYIFIFFFIYVVLNMNIVMIEEAYFATRFQANRYERHPHQKRSAWKQASPGAASNEPIQQSSSQDSNQVSSPLLQPVRGSSDKLPMRGQMSPRFMDNPRLQGLLADAFESETPTSSHLTATSGTALLPPPIGDDQGSLVNWWMTALPQWTKWMQSTTLPRRGEVFEGEDVWGQLEELLTQHANTINEVVAKLYCDWPRQ